MRRTGCGLITEGFFLVQQEHQLTPLIFHDFISPLSSVWKVR
jgi:hypothetical protein